MMPNWLKKRAYLTPNGQRLFSGVKPQHYAELYHASLEMAGKLTSIGASEKQFVGLYYEIILILLSSFWRYNL